MKSVAQRTYEGNQHANSKEGSADDRDDPVDFIISRPSIDKQGNRHKKRTWDHRRQSVFWLLDSVLGREVLQDTIGRPAQKYKSNKRADTDSKIRETDGSLREAVLAFEDLADGREQEVEVSVDYADVEGKEEDDW